MPGIEIKIQRSDFHFHDFCKMFQGRRDRDAYKFVAEVKHNGTQHFYRADRPPPDDDRWGLIAGDCVHNLRSALDHLAVQLVIANGGAAGNKTSFPIWFRRPHAPHTSDS